MLSAVIFFLQLQHVGVTVVVRSLRLFTQSATGTSKNCTALGGYYGQSKST